MKFKNKMKMFFCKHKNTETQMWQPTHYIKVCKDCGHKDFGYHNKKFLFKI